MENISNTIDWFSFTVMLRDSAHGNVDMLLDDIARSLRTLIGDDSFENVFGVGDWLWGAGRKPYKHSYKQSGSNLTVYCGGQNHALIEFSGTSCALYDTNGYLMPVILSAKERVTRLDVALDFEGTNATELQSMFNNDRVKARGYQSSMDGTTYYIGSKKSDRYIRVYEYNSPHPREGKPRIEFQLKRENAQIAIESVAKNGIAHLSQQLINTSFELPISVSDTDETLKAYRKDRKASKTMRWIKTTVAGAIKKAIISGEIDNPKQFFVQWFLPEGYEIDVD